MAARRKGTLEISWCSRPLPLFELVAKFQLPIIAKSANTVVSDGASTGCIVAEEIYHMQRMVQVQKVIAQVLPTTVKYHGNTSRAFVQSKCLELSIPKDYTGLFQVLPFGNSVHNGLNIPDILNSMPRYIKAEETCTRKRRQVQLNAGDVLEVLGTTMRSTKSGVKEFLRLRKKHIEFVLGPDIEGTTFQVLEDAAEYSLAEILERFPLPQKVALVKAEQHSEILLNLLAGKRGLFLLTREYQDEYVIGVDIQGRNGLVVHIDTDVHFYFPDWLTSRGPTCADGNQDDIISRRPGNRETGDLSLEHMICKEKDKLIVLEPWEHIFKDPPPILWIKRLTEAVGSDCYKKKHHGNILTEEETTVAPHGVKLVESGDSSGSDGYEKIHLGNVERSDILTEEEATVIPQSVKSVESGDGFDYDGYEKISLGNVERSDIITGKTLNQFADNDQEQLQQMRPKLIFDSAYINTSRPKRNAEEPEHVPSIPPRTARDIGIPSSSYCQPNTLPDQIFSSSRNNAAVFKRLDRTTLPNTRLLSKQVDPKCTQSYPTRIVDVSRICKQFETSNTPLPTEVHSNPKSKGTNRPIPDLLSSDALTETPNTNKDPDLPSNEYELQKCSVDTVVDVLKVLNISDYVQEQFRKNSIDGESFCSLDADFLHEEFQLSKLHAMKIMNFIGGWRPNTGTV